MSKESTSSSGIGFAGMLTILFVGLKLTHHHIDWSWLWVMSPLWIGFGALAVFLLVCVVLAAIFN